MCYFSAFVVKIYIYILLDEVSHDVEDLRCILREIIIQFSMAMTLKHIIHQTFYIFSVLYYTPAW